jgi:hypothetical protein
LKYLHRYNFLSSFLSRKYNTFVSFLHDFEPAYRQVGRARLPVPCLPAGRRHPGMGGIKIF